MRSMLGLLCQFYARLLMLYPKTFREEYGEELQVVFELSLVEAAAIGGFEVERVILRELVSLPRAVFLEHLRQWRTAGMKRSFDLASGSWREFLTALLPFFLVGGLPPLLDYLDIIGITTNAIRTVITLALFGLFLILLSLGVKRGMPRWSLPYLGFLFAILSVYPFSMIFGTPVYFIFRNVRDEGLFFVDLLWDGIFWYGLLSAMIVLTLLVQVSPAFRHFRNDWTQLNFILYGAVPFAIWMSFDEYVGEEPILLLAFLILAIGAWIYLHSRNEWMRFAVLFVGLTLAMVITTVGKVILIPAQSWSNALDEGFTTSDAKHTIFMWGWFALGMVLPVAARLLPRSDRSLPTSVAEG